MGPLRTLAVLASILAAPAAAQDRPESMRLGGMTFDHWRGASGRALLRPTLRATNLPPGGPGLDLALVIFPDGISVKPPGIVVGLQAGLAQRIPVGPVSLILKGGFAGIAVAGALSDQRFFRLHPGIQVGAGLLVPVEKASSIRFDVTRHAYRSMGYTTGVWSVGVGFAVPHRAAR